MAVNRLGAKVPSALFQQTRQLTGSGSQLGAAAAVAKAEPKALPTEPLKVSTLKSGLTLASQDSGNPVVTLGVVVKAGSRNEGYGNAGLCHTLRVAAGLATKKNSSFGITRNLQQAGASLSCLQGREHTLYTIQATRDNTDIALEYLADVVSNQAFKPWELSSLVPRLKLELAQQSPATAALELLHAAAFRGGLGNSLYSPAHKVGSHTTAQMQEFVTKNFTANSAALVGIGVPHATLTKFASLISLEGKSGSPTGSVYSGGELRQETGGNMTYVALAAQCAGAVNVAEAVAAMLLQRVLGMGSHIKYAGGSGKLSKAASAAAGGNFAVSGIGNIYSDSGLIGAMVVSEAASAGKVVGAVASALRNCSVTEEDVAAAKKNILVDVYAALENPATQVEDIGTQVLLAGDVIPVEKVAALISEVSTADVAAAAKKLSTAKLSLGAIGNLSTVPYLDSL